MKGILYIVSQIVGGLIGALLVTTLLKGDGDAVYKRPAYKLLDPAEGEVGGFYCALGEVMGTFLFCLFYMISTDKETRYSTDNVLNCLVISASYLAAKQFAGGVILTHEGTPLNPAIAFGYAIFGGNLGHW